MATKIQVRRDTATNWAAAQTSLGNTPVLAQGEIGYILGTNQFKIGDGTSLWGGLTAFTAGSGGGNGSNISNGTSNVAIAAINGNVTVGVNGNAIATFTGVGANITGTLGVTGIANLASNLNVSGTSNLGPVGNVRITGGTNGQFLQTNGSGGLSWSTPAGTGGGTGTPGGANTQVQFNNNSSFGGNPNFTWDSATNTLRASIFAGSGANLTNIPAGNLVGAVDTANVVANAAQPNITSVGTLTSLNVSGVATLSSGNITFPSLANVIITNGGTVGQVIEKGPTGLTWGNKTTAVTAGGSNNQVQINNNDSFFGSPNLTFDGNVLTVTGNVSATRVTGNGSSMTGVATLAAAIPTGNTAAGSVGQIAFDTANNYMYVCVTTNLWRRTLLSTFGGAGTPSTITTTSLPTAVISSTYITQLTAAGDTPINWSITGGANSSGIWTGGNLPAGLSLAASTGVISGTPTALATSGNVTLVATGATLPANSKTLTLTVIPAGTAPNITTTTLLNAQTGVIYSQTLQKTGTAPITWSLASGELPANVSLGVSSGIIFGNATTSGTSNFTVRATNLYGFDDQALSLTVGSSTAPVIVETPLAGTTETATTLYVTSGAAYNRPISVTGTSPITWSVTTGALPTGLSLGSANGVISGTTTVIGNVNVTITATNSVGTDTFVRVISVGTAPTIITNSSDLAAATVGVAYNETLIAGGTGPTTWS